MSQVSVRCSTKAYGWLTRHKELSGVPMATTIEKALEAYLNIGTATDKLLPKHNIDCGKDNA